MTRSIRVICDGDLCDKAPANHLLPSGCHISRVYACLLSQESASFGPQGFGRAVPFHLWERALRDWNVMESALNELPSTNSPSLDWATSLDHVRVMFFPKQRSGLRRQQRTFDLIFGLQAKPGDRVQVIGIYRSFPPPLQAVQITPRRLFSAFSLKREKERERE